MLRRTDESPAVRSRESHSLCCVAHLTPSPTVEYVVAANDLVAFYGYSAERGIFRRLKHRNAAWGGAFIFILSLVAAFISKSPVWVGLGALSAAIFVPIDLFIAWPRAIARNARRVA